jgi:hypothetical protein
MTKKCVIRSLSNLQCIFQTIIKIIKLLLDIFGAADPSKSNPYTPKADFSKLELVFFGKNKFQAGC